MSGKVGRPRTKKSKFCKHCDVKVGDGSKSLCCPQCAKNSYLPTPEDIEVACDIMRQKRYASQPQCESSPELRTSYQPRVYRMPRSFR